MPKIANMQEVRIDLLRPYENNAKIHGRDQIEKLKKSIEEFGFLNPCLIDRDYNLIAGHGRVMAARELGFETVPCVFLEGLTEAQRRAYILADNRLSELGEWDMDIVVDELRDLSNMDFDISITGFELEDDEPDVYEDEGFDETRAEPRAKRGDIYQLGDHRLMCGDATSSADVQMLMGGARADLFLTDPPYNVALGMGGSVDDARKRHRRTDGLVIMNDQMEDDEFREFLRLAFSAAGGVLCAGSAFYIWHADNESYNFRGALADAGLTLRQTLIWNKNSITLGRQDYQWKHEPCLYGWADGAAHKWYSDRKQSTVLDYDKPQRSEEHPTMKPVPLFAYLITNSTKKGDTVLDTFAGSGTTVVACEETGRRAYCMELDPHYCDVIITRWEEFTGKKAVLLNA